MLGRMTPTAVAQAQLDAYNAKDLEAFCACYHPDVLIEDGRGQPLVQGMEELRAFYAKRFALPLLHAELVGRLTAGPWVADQERIVGIGPEPVHAIACYLVEDGRIRRVRMLRA